MFRKLDALRDDATRHSSTRSTHASLPSTLFWDALRQQCNPNPKLPYAGDHVRRQRHTAMYLGEHIQACKQSHDRGSIVCDSQHLLLVCLQGPNNHNQIVCDCSLTTLMESILVGNVSAKLASGADVVFGTIRPRIVLLSEIPLDRRGT